jgi:hypothetical protein
MGKIDNRCNYIQPSEEKIFTEKKTKYFKNYRNVCGRKTEGFA